MNNTLASNRPATKAFSKKAKSRKSKNQVKFVAIPLEDLQWAKEQKPSVMKFWMECWECDPYGSRWMVLNHTLSTAAFQKAKKILHKKDLFIFKPDRSIRDGRETVCWLVKNLHGARRPNHGIEIEPPGEDSFNQIGSSQAGVKTPIKIMDAPRGDSIDSKTYTPQGFQPPSITSHQHLIGGDDDGQELKKTEVSEDDRNFALDGQVASVSHSVEKKEEKQFTSPTKVETNFSANSKIETEDLGALNKKSTHDALNQDYKFDWRTSDAAERAVAQNLAIEASRNTEEYQKTAKDAFARLRAKFEGQRQEKVQERLKRLSGED